MIRIFINILLLVIGIFPSTSQTTATREYQVKAAFLFNFTQFIEWPETAFPETRSPVVIGILGKNPFDNYLDEIISGEQVNGHPLIVKKYKDIDEIKMCHILFINFEATDKIKEAITALEGRSILTVSDQNKFIEEGGMIRFMTRDDKIRIQINPLPAKEADLIISSKLLRVAELVSQNNN